MSEMGNENENECKSIEEETSIERNDRWKKVWLKKNEIESEAVQVHMDGPLLNGFDTLSYDTYKKVVRVTFQGIGACDFVRRHFTESPSRNTLKILDTGCGTGVFLACLHDFFYHDRDCRIEAVGTDYNANAIKVAQLRQKQCSSSSQGTRSSSLERLTDTTEFAVGDVLGLQNTPILRKRKFNLITNWGVTIYLNSKEDVLSMAEAMVGLLDFDDGDCEEGLIIIGENRDPHRFLGANAMRKELESKQQRVVDDNQLNHLHLDCDWWANDFKDELQSRVGQEYEIEVSVFRQWQSAELMDIYCNAIYAYSAAIKVHKRRSI